MLWVKKDFLSRKPINRKHQNKYNCQKVNPMSNQSILEAYPATRLSFLGYLKQVKLDFLLLVIEITSNYRMNENL